LRERMLVRPGANPGCSAVALHDFGAPDNAHIRVLPLTGEPICHTPRAPDLGFPRTGAADVGDFRVESRLIPVPPLGRAVLQYAQPRASEEHTISKVRFFLLFGVLGGTGLALLAGLYVARRAMAPIAALTRTAREIERTRDPSRRVP